METITQSWMPVFPLSKISLAMQTIIKWLTFWRLLKEIRFRIQILVRTALPFLISSHFLWIPRKIVRERTSISNSLWTVMVKWMQLIIILTTNRKSLSGFQPCIRSRWTTNPYRMVCRIENRQTNRISRLKLETSMWMLIYHSSIMLIFRANSMMPCFLPPPSQHWSKIVAQNAKWCYHNKSPNRVWTEMLWPCSESCINQPQF